MNNSLLAAFNIYLQAVESQKTSSAQFCQDLINFCHQNIQFYRELKNSQEFKELLMQFTEEKFNLHISLEQITDSLEKASFSIIAEEYPFPIGKYPTDLFINDAGQLASTIEFIMKNLWPPSQKINLKSDKLFCIGSCFATNIANHLSNIGAHVHTTVIAENINSPRNNLDLFRYFDTGVPSGLFTSNNIIAKFNPDEIRNNFVSSDVLILTLGCAFSLISQSTGLPQDRLSPDSAFDKPTTQSIKSQLLEIFNIAKRNNIKKIFMSVSPVPLAGTLIHNANPYVSDMVSKSILRSAANEICEEYDDIFYIPTFEIFRQTALHTYFPTFGLHDGFSRHVNEDIVKEAIASFIKFYAV